MFKDKEYELVIKYYSLAMSYVPQTGVENNKMSAVLLSNRCAAYLHLEMYDKAINDAKRCIKIEPEWSKVRVQLPVYVYLITVKHGLATQRKNSCTERVAQV